MAIGSKNGCFTEFNDNGHGVKITNFNPWINSNISNTYVVALKYQQEEFYYGNNEGDSGGFIYTFYSYFWNEILEEWKLYGIGQKFIMANNKIDSFYIKSLVEFSGSVDKNRIGHFKNKIFYKGFLKNLKTRNWQEINQMHIQEQLKNKYVNKQYSATTNQTFSVVIGGLNQYKTKNKFILKLTSFSREVPKYMHANKIDKLEKEIEFPQITNHKINNTFIQLYINVPSFANNINHTIYLFSGKIDGLSLESKWSQKNTFHNISNETSYLEIKYNETFKFYRILVKNDQLQIWNKKSYVISHKIKRQMSSNYNDNDDDNNDNDDDDDMNLVNNINKTIVSD